MKKRRNFLSLIITISMLIMMMVIPVSADEVDEDVKEARKGVLQLQLYYEDKDGNSGIIGGGSGFLINEDTLLTCYHVVHVEENPENYREVQNTFGTDFDSSRINVLF